MLKVAAVVAIWVTGFIVVEVASTAIRTRGLKKQLELMRNHIRPAEKTIN